MELLGRDHPAQQPTVPCVLRVEDPAEEQDLLREGFTDQLDEPPASPCCGQDPQLPFRVADLRARRTDPEVAGLGEFRAASERVT